MPYRDLSPTKSSWVMMRNRCNNPRSMDFRRYGGRGIRVCERWASFANFLADMGERPGGTTLDRIDNDGNYEPGNCRWATRLVQARNRTQWNRSGKRNPNFRISDEIASEVRANYLLCRVTYKELADRYHMSAVTVGRIVRGQRFRSMIEDN